MKRFGIAFAGVFLASMIAGCGGGIEEGRPTSWSRRTRSPRALKDFMKQNAGKMANQKKPAKTKNEPTSESHPSPGKKRVMESSDVRIEHESLPRLELDRIAG